MNVMNGRTTCTRGQIIN